MNCVLIYGYSLTRNLFRPAGPFRLTTALRNAGFSAVCLDVANLEGSRIALWDAIIDKYVDENTLWFGVSTTFLSHVLGVPIRRLSSYEQFEDRGTSALLEHVVARCKLRSPNIRFLVGGALFINLEKHGFYSITGYADSEIVEFTRSLQDPSFKPSYARIGRRIEGSEYSDFSTSEIEWAAQDIMRPGDVLPLEVSRGCVFRCKFCAFPLNGKSKGEWVKRTDVLVRELTRNYEHWGTTQYVVCDDTFNDSTDKLRELHAAITKLPFKLDLTAYLRLDLLMRFPEQADLLREMGLRCALFGIETVNNKSAKAIGKGVPFVQQIDFLWKMRASKLKGVLLSSGFILGLPFDTLQTIEDTKSFLYGPGNPLDHWLVSPLGLNPKKDSRHKKFFSEFDLEYEKHGYVLRQPTDRSTQPWDLGELTFEACETAAAEIDKVSRTLPNFKYGSFFYAGASHLIPKEDLHRKPIRDLVKQYDIPALTDARVEDYYKRILE